MNKPVSNSFPAFIVAAILMNMLISGCAPRRYDSLNVSHRTQLEQVEKQMLEGHSAEIEIDRKISEAVKQLAATLHPAFRNHHWRKSRLGFLEISGINRINITQLHKYITEKTLTFSFLQPAIADNFIIVERFFLQDVLRELRIENPEYYPVIDLTLAKMLGRMYGVDVIETGVVTESPDFLDFNLRMIETRNGNIIGVGSVKIEKTQLIRHWLNEMGARYWQDLY